MTVTSEMKVKEVEDMEIKSYGWGIRHVQVFCMAATMSVLFMARSSMAVAVLAMTDMSRINDTQTMIFDWDKNTQGVILSSFFWGYFVMQIPSGLMAKRFGGKPVILAALIANGIICLVIPLLLRWGDWPLLCACRVTMGLTQACLFSSCHTLLGRWLPAHERTTFGGIVYGGGNMGIIAGLPIYGLLSSTTYGWQLIFYMTSILVLLMAVIWWKFTASSPREHGMIHAEEREYIEDGLAVAKIQQNQHTPWLAFFKCKHFWAILVAHVGYNIYFTFLFVDMPAYLEKGLNISIKNSASLSALPYIVMWFGNIISTSLCDKTVNRKLVTRGCFRRISNSIAFLSVALGLVVMSLISSENKTVVLVTMVLTFSLEGFVTAGFVVNHLDLSPNFGGVMLSITNTAANIGSIATPLITSYILQNDATSIERWHMVFLLIAAICVVTNSVYVVFTSSERQPFDDPSIDRKLGFEDEVKPVLGDVKNL